MGSNSLYEVNGGAVLKATAKATGPKDHILIRILMVRAIPLSCVLEPEGKNLMFIYHISYTIYSVPHIVYPMDPYVYVVFEALSVLNPQSLPAGVSTRPCPGSHAKGN